MTYNEYEGTSLDTSFPCQMSCFLFAEIGDLQAPSVACVIEWEIGLGSDAKMHISGNILHACRSDRLDFA